ncbi:ABC transporter ATP-binding protein [Georgenia sp. Z1344]|uniref:ABC transporter ATP-binding protein n=1 Tax=Georgenia sp. Z1344 TaxID=3416706 RepID=UPI003CEA1D99
MSVTTTPTTPGTTSTPTAQDAAALTCRGLGFRYHGAEGNALTNLDLDAAPGSITALVGPSGCGKTTLLKLVGGLLRPTAGTIHVDDVDTTTVPLAKRRVGWVPQQYALFDHLDVTGNVTFGLKAQGVPAQKRAERVTEMLELCQIADLAHRPVTELSGGQRQRVAIARALAPSPRLLLLDEPLAALDPQLRVLLRSELAALVRASGVTTLLVTHDQDEAFALGDQLVLLRAGNLVQSGEPAELWDRPATSWAAEFLGHAVVVPATRDGEHHARLAGGLRLPAGTSPDDDTTNSLEDTDMHVALRWTDLTAYPTDAETAALTNGAATGTVVTSEFAGDRYRLTVALTDGPTVPAHSVYASEVDSAVAVRPSGSRAVPVVTR